MGVCFARLLITMPQLLGYYHCVTLGVCSAQVSWTEHCWRIITDDV